MPSLAAMGVTCIWIPPACKAFGPDSTGYDTYDLWDLGEFDQKGGIATKYGTLEGLRQLAHRAADYGVELLFDVVINHKAGAERTERVRGLRVEEFGRCS